MVLTIGRLAKKASVTVETVRYYERRGLIKQPAKPKAGYRKYGRDALGRLLFIKKAQTLGFSLDDIEKLLLLSEGRCVDVQYIAEQKLDHIKSKVEDLRRLEKVLEQLVMKCRDNVDETQCPIIETLLDEN